MHSPSRSARHAILWLFAFSFLALPQAACEGDLAIETSASQRQDDPPPQMGQNPPPRILVDDGGVPPDAAIPAPPTPLEPTDPPPSCSPFCQGRECGPDGCGGVCGACAADWTCGDTFQCTPPAPSGPDVVLYGADWCGYCREAKRWFEANDVEFTEYDLDEPGVQSQAADRVQELTGSRSVSTPTIIIDETVIHGWGEGEVRRALGM